MFPRWLQSLHPGSYSCPGTFPLLPSAKRVTLPGINDGHSSLTVCSHYTPPLHLPWILSCWLFSGPLAFSLPHSLFFYPLSSNFLLQSAHGTCPLNLAAWAALPCHLQAFSHQVMEKQPVPKNNVKRKAQDIVMRHGDSGVKKTHAVPHLPSLYSHSLTSNPSIVLLFRRRLLEQAHATQTSYCSHPQ